MSARRQNSWRPTGRCLHLVDVENLAGFNHRDPEAIHHTAELYERSIAIEDGDHIWVASNPGIAHAVRQAWPVARLLVRHGPDGADRALLDAADPLDIASRFDKVVIASGDRIFAGLVLELHMLRLDVTVASLRQSLSDRLRRVAPNLCILDDDQMDDTGIAEAV